MPFVKTVGRLSTQQSSCPSSFWEPRFCSGNMCPVLSPRGWIMTDLRESWIPCWTILFGKACPYCWKHLEWNLLLVAGTSSLRHVLLFLIVSKLSSSLLQQGRLVTNDSVSLKQKTGLHLRKSTILLRLRPNKTRVGKYPRIYPMDLKSHTRTPM